MRSEPSIKRTVAFVDGQNLFHSVKAAFGYLRPNYNVLLLAQSVCAARGWSLTAVRFYTGIPDSSDDPYWHAFWSWKMTVMGREGVVLFSRSLRYRKRKVVLPDGRSHTYFGGEEKGIDVRIAIDAIRLAYHGEYDVALIFSQDQDFSEVAKEIHTISREQDRWIKVASAFPMSPGLQNRRGIDNTDWIPFDQAIYSSCIDHRDYRPKS